MIIGNSLSLNVRCGSKRAVCTERGFFIVVVLTEGISTKKPLPSVGPVVNKKALFQWDFQPNPTRLETSLESFFASIWTYIS